MPAIPAQTPDAATARPRLRLDFLDGLRGLAALYVALFHVVGAQRLAQTALPLRLATGWMHYGYYAVDVFIVLSGYCLMLPVARADGGRLRGGPVGFFRRRARRILPPYYAACAVSLLLILAARLAKTRVQADEPGVFAPGNLLAHLLLLHNLRSDWSSSVNIVLWSVATEWQIYFVFALLLLPVWRRLGSMGAVAVGFLVGFLPHFLLPGGHNFDWARPWYIGLFATGMAGAVLGFSADARQARSPALGLALAGVLRRLLPPGVAVHAGAAVAVAERPPGRRGDGVPDRSVRSGADGPVRREAALSAARVRAALGRGPGGVLV